MRVNIYAEEITDRIEIVTKTAEGDGGRFTGIRFYLELPVSLATPPAKLGQQPGIAHVSGPFIHHVGDDDSSAVTFWGKRDLRIALRKALDLLDKHYAVEDEKRGTQRGMANPL
jgi:hypothetical protein